MIRLPGLVCDDAFARRLARTIESRHVSMVATCPGYAVDDACMRLTACLRDLAGPVVDWVQLAPGDLEHDDGTLHAISVALGWAPIDSADVESRVFQNADLLDRARLVVVQVP